MKYFKLTPTDQRENTWLLYSYTDRVRLRSAYEDLRCGFCRKVNEEAALKRGIEPDVRVASKDDYLLSSDTFMLMSSKLREKLRSAGITGIRWYEIPGDDRYSVAWPALLVPTNPATAGIKIQGPICPECGRPHETAMRPILASMKLPDDPMAIFASELWVEKSRGKMTCFTAGEPVVDVLKSLGATGIEYLPIKHP